MNLHHSFFAEESQLDTQFSFTPGQDYCYFSGNGADLCLRYNPGLTAKCELLKRKIPPSVTSTDVSFVTHHVHCDAGVFL